MDEDVEVDMDMDVDVDVDAKVHKGSPEWRLTGVIQGLTIPIETSWSFEVKSVQVLKIPQIFAAHREYTTFLSICHSFQINLISQNTLSFKVYLCRLMRMFIILGSC